MDGFVGLEPSDVPQLDGSILTRSVHTADVIVNTVHGTDAHRAQAGQYVGDGPGMIPHRSTLCKMKDYYKVNIDARRKALKRGR